MHFRPQHALSSLHTFNLLDLIAQTPGGFILVKQGKRCQDSQRETFSTPRTTDSFVVSLGLFLCPFRGATNLKNNVLQSSVKLPMDCVILFRKEPDRLPADGGSSDSAGSLQTLLWQTLSADNQTTLMDTAMIVWLLWLMVDGCCWCWWSGQHLQVSFLYRNRLIAAWRCSAECRVGPLLFETWRLWRDFKMKSRFGVRKYDLVTDSSLQVTF